MPSAALDSLVLGLAEVKRLSSADPTRPGRLPKDPEIARAVGRGCVVLLTGHFEGYLSVLNAIAVEAVNTRGVMSEQLEIPLRLRHSRSPVEGLARVQWDNRAAALEGFVSNEAWLWRPGARGTLSHERLLEGVTSPMPTDLRRYFELWGVRDVFARITRKPHTKGRLWLGIRDLVDKRHAIAHGDATAEATKQDVMTYVSVVETFCRRTDRLISQHLGRQLGIATW